MTYTPPAFGIQFDLDRDGTYETDAVADVTDRTGGLVIKRGMGKDGIYQISEIQFALDNADGAWTPEYPSATYYGQMGVDVPVRVTATHNAVPYTLWTGYVQRWQTRTQRGVDAETIVRAADLGKYLVESAPVNLAISKVRDTDGAIEAVLTALGLTSGDWTLDDGVQDLAYSYATGQAAMDAILGFVRAELGGLAWITADGKFRFEARNSRLGTTVDDTWGDGTTIIPENVDYEITDQDVVTQANVRGTRHLDGQDGEEIFAWALNKTSGQTVLLTAGQVYKSSFKLTSPVLSNYDAVAYQDYGANDNATGTSTDRTGLLTVTYTLVGGGQIDVSITNGHSGSVYVTKLRARGQSVAFYADRPEAVYSLAIPNRKAGAVVNVDVPWVQADATSLLDWAVQIVHTYRQPWPRVTLGFAWDNDDTVAAMLGVELGDLIRFTDTAAAQWGSAVDDWLYVEAIEHRLVPARELRSTITLVPSYLYRNLDRIVYDDFGRANGALGTARSGDAWADASSMTIVSNAARATSDTLQMPTLNVGAGATVQAVEASLAAIGAGDEVGVVFGYVDANNQYRAYVDKGSNEVILEKNVASVVTELSSPAFTVGTSHEIRVLRQSTRIRVWVDRRLYIDTTDSALTTGTSAGLFARNANATTTFDNFYGQGL